MTTTISAYALNGYNAWTKCNDSDAHLWAWAFLAISGVADTVKANDLNALIEGCDDLIDAATGDYRDILITAVEDVLGHFGLL